MGRMAAILAVLMATLASPAVAREACDGFRVEPFVAAVPYYAEKMRAVDAGEGGLGYVHPDDGRISVSFRLQVVAEQPQTTRAEFTRELSARLAHEFQPRGDVVYRTSVNPYDPIAWTVQSRQALGDDMVSKGTQAVRIAPTCNLVASWNVVEAPVLASRIKEFNSALEAVRTLSVKRMDPNGFLPDSTVPTGYRALVLGLGLPLAASVVLFLAMRSMLFHGRGGSPVRALCLAAATCACLGAALQVPRYHEGLDELRHIDNAAVLALVMASYLVAAATGEARALLWAFSVSLSSSVALGVCAFLSWSPDRAVSSVTALALLAFGAGGLRKWQTQVEARRRRGRATSAA